MSKPRETEIRKEAIKELIKRFPIENQETLVSLLKEEHDIDTNQSIISRDLKELGVIKHRIQGSMVYDLDNKDISKEILRLGITNVTHNEAMIAIATLPGMAAFVGDYLDNHPEAGVLATLAGENVVLVVPTTIKNIEEIFEKICMLLHVKHHKSS